MESSIHKLPQHVSFAHFLTIATLEPLKNHGRVGQVFFAGQHCGFVDALGEEGLRQAHRAHVNNALYANSPDAPEFLARHLPSPEALQDYPELRTLFPVAAALVTQAELAR